MKYSFMRTKKNIAEINRDFQKGRLFVDATYQRRKVWNDQDKVRLIETILIDFIMPEVFFWTAERDPETGLACTHIVDGQQRISTIVEFINGDISLKEKHLTNDVIKNECGNKTFAELDEKYKNKFWEYPISVVEIDADCTRAEIKQMFYRLNMTNYNLNPQEKRNSRDSKFGDKCEALSTYDFWKKVRIFSSTDAKRMKDVEYCCAIYILANEGIVDQTNDKKINDYYDDYKDEFDKDNSLQDKILRAMDLIESLIDKTTISFISKKAQMYTLFSVAFRIFENDIIEKQLFEKFKMFVNAYSKFRNEFDGNYKDVEMAELFADIKKYKLASSEGINKLGNRVIRFETLFKICINSDDRVLDILRMLAEDFEKKLEAKSQKDTLEQDDLVDIQE